MSAGISIVHLVQIATPFILVSGTPPPPPGNILAMTWSPGNVQAMNWSPGNVQAMNWSATDLDMTWSV